MATFYLDLEGGNDANDGTTFANRWKTFTSGATAARIAPGDTIRVMGSTNPTSLGVTGAWTNGPLEASQSVTSSTNATPIVVTKASHGYSNGDTVCIASHTTNVNANGTWEIANVTANTFELVGSTGTAGAGSGGTVRRINNCRVTLGSALTANIASTANRGEGRAVWTASANVTATLITTTTKCSDVADQLAIAAGFTTGLAAYYATGTLNLSTYQGVSFYIRQSSGTVAVSGDVQLNLCTDTAGVTSVHTIPIPALALTNSWYPVYWDNAGNLNSAIKSIGFTVNVDRGAQTFQISNVIAVKASGNDNLNLTSLIGKNTAGETFWGIQSINGTRVILDGNKTSILSDGTTRGYMGTTETVTTYKRECIQSLTSANNAVQDSGTAGSPITFSGGWDRTNMSSQTLETWVDGRNVTVNGFNGNTKNYITIEKLNAVRYGSGITLPGSSGSDNTVTGDITVSHCYTAGLAMGEACTITGAVSAHGNNAYGLYTNTGQRGGYVSSAKLYGNGIDGTSAAFFQQPAYGLVAGAIIASNNAGIGATISDDANIASLTCNYNASSGLNWSGGHGSILGYLESVSNGTTGLIMGVSAAVPTGTLRIKSGSITGNSSNGILMLYGTLYMHRVTLTHTPEFNISAVASNSDGTACFSEHHDNVTDAHLVTVPGGTIQYTGGVWQFMPTSTTLITQYFPLSLPIGKFAVRASAQVTITASMKRDNAGLTGKLVLPAYSLSGVGTADVTSSISGTGAYENVTITFTPTEAGVVEVYAQCYGGTTYNMYVQNCSASQP